MAQLPSELLPYTYGGRTYIRPDAVTELPFIAPAAPDVVPNVVPTIMRHFADE